MNHSLDHQDLMHSSFNAELQSRHGFKLLFCKKISIFLLVPEKQPEEICQFSESRFKKTFRKTRYFWFSVLFELFPVRLKNSFRSRIYVSSSKTRFERNFQLEVRYGSEQKKL